MALTLKIIFWACVGAVAYNYAGYPVVLFLLGALAQAKSDISFFLNRKSRRAASPSGTAAHQPTIAIVISAFNEESVIEDRVKNALEINYPEQLTEILIGLDSPSDSTSAILSRIQSPRVHVFHFTTRRGKLAVITDLAQRTSAEILVFTDANTMFQPDCVPNLVRHFSDPRVGAVSGEEVRVTTPGTDPAAEGLYWKYESALKILESRLHSLHSANGGVYAIRRELFRPEPNLIVEDFQIPLDLRFQGHWIVYDPGAIGVEEIAPTFGSQFERRVRLGAGNFQTLFGHPEYLNPFKGRAAFAYLSHRVLRWITPFLMIAALAATAGLVRHKFYLAFFVAQCVFYALALIGFWLKKTGRSVGVCRIPLYFCTMNAAMLFGLFRRLGGRQSAAWAATPRTAAATDAIPSRTGEQ
jgi:cellulose synthase/poly-beta-1,6-N-acetylglucosamine synthase-like glycosyltransferase